ncbi:DUF4190 domain-containing protein [Georgenia alba]|uniref:DUF4190 domain-containing protein n=1 Tax=Georgenia alba TaxID=2233858 RepID=A0ABW2QHV4_9MICO
MTSSWGQGPPAQQPQGYGAPQGPPTGGGYQGPAGPYGQQQSPMAVDPSAYGVSFSSGQPYNSVPQHRATTNAGQSMGIASIFVGVPLGPLGMVLGFISQQKAKRGHGPQGFGIAGMIVGGLSTAAVTLFVLSLLSSSLSAYAPPTDPGGGQPAPQPTADGSDGSTAPASPGSGEEIPVGNMQVLTCAHRLESGVPVVTIVDCGEWHQVEAFLEVPLGQGEFPGDDAVDTAAIEQCVAAGNSVTFPPGVDPSVIAIDALTPGREAWNNGVTSALCLAIHPDGPNMSGTFGSESFQIR